ncbi:MAG: 3-methyl-2-oxobutanoate hydroxymethyltransferase [Candidatus Carbobacillus altaicus]|uniref:3-methyl-2-oxobutanoate hydroxymethyltransferase n=1 Tax=Candidatus Carbonibacillus altaicus TaxID=2163959 RepID=A0A2R6Y2L4_9BACL|nr:3-methyl-2-oxobutanoate hydroxymethyltransferase [Candidatus Carbobacillus altaicus]PTQ56930.1 MAG: 3-methyl-2-oxobutanoate hydroxymethyltransferase [Candidatus Carbobacillus altaicus]
MVNRKALTTSDLLKMKQNGQKITMVTAYDAPSARLVEGAGLDLILVGDSLGMVVLGYETTVSVTLEEMIHHTKAVRRGAPQTMIVADMPFLTAHYSLDQVLQAAGRLMQEAGAQAIKLEGGREIADTVAHLTRAGVPVMGHIGLQPQSVLKLGGYRVAGKSDEGRAALLEDARALEAAGAFSIVIEAVPEPVARAITDDLTIPTIGIGAGRYVDGQVLVFHDLIGLTFGHQAKFVKRYANIKDTIEQALVQYRDEVKGEIFPALEHTYEA